MRKNSFAVGGGAFGDEGKGRIVDELASSLSSRYKNIIVYRWSGGSNAGHTVIANGRKIILHQVPSGALTAGAISILGKGMVIHPGDLLSELRLVSKEVKQTPKIIIDEMATLTLDTHRAFEATLKKWKIGGASTGRGIAPAYADILLRQYLTVRDLVKRNWKKDFSRHYDLYRAMVKGLGENMQGQMVNSLKDGLTKVGTKQVFLNRLSNQRKYLKAFVKDANYLLSDTWDSDTPFIFEGAQGIGLDARWAVCPDTTSANPCFDGIKNSTEGIVKVDDIQTRILTYKATYTSSVGHRVLPTKMKKGLVEKIRKDANEYGATTGRPRDIYHIDLPMLKFFANVGNATHIALTHLDISYPKVPVKVCVKYKNRGKKESVYRPDQIKLNSVRPEYKIFKPWNGKEIRKISSYSFLPKSTQIYIHFMAESLKLRPYILTTGPERSSVVSFPKSRGLS